MAETRQRKSKGAETAGGNGGDEAKKPAKAGSPAASASTKKPSSSSLIATVFVTLATALIVLATLGATIVSVSLVTTNSLTFGYKVPHWRNLIRWKERIFTLEELAQYDGSNPDLPIYIAINGRVFDVSAGPKYYGKGGGYSFFAGKDAARAYITGCFETHLTHDLRGLSEAEIDSLKQWTSFYDNSDKYFYVGKVLHPPIPDDVPIPEPCNQ
ncbi:cytochrome b5-like heme/steroid binding domain-containing protein [Zopfochytrium polystomum]|nr:cytochrome b5-like heme/steroid binding domain-containing protein [Zopfochytrium polystomum]